VRVLVVEDETQLADAVVRGLRREGMAVDVAYDGDDGYSKATQTRYDVVVLDRDLPGKSGDEICRTLTDEGVLTRVIMLTASGSIEDKVEGLALGADDYLAKPFAFDERLARVRALFRRGSERRAPVLRLADLTLDPATRKVERSGRRIELTTREWALLEYFMRNAGRILTRPMLVQHVWGLDFDPESNIVDVYVGYLRRKIDGPQEQKLFHTIRGAGYVLKDEP